MIKQVHFAGVYVSDTTKAFDFYANKLGFDVHTDVDMGNNRWMEFAPNGAETRLAVTKPWNDGSESKVGVVTNIVFATNDIQATYDELIIAGVHFTESPTEQSWGDMTARFEDPDGNSFVLVESKD